MTQYQLQKTTQLKLKCQNYTFLYHPLPAATTHSQIEYIEMYWEENF
jgi:hypothetical protein